MKMSIFEKLKAKKDKVTDARDQIRKDMEDLRAKTESLEDEERAAAEAEDLDRYMKAKEEQNRTAALIRMKELKLSKIEDVPESEVYSSWDEYRTGYAKDFQRTLASLEKAREQYLQAVRAVIIAQNDGLKQQKDYGALLGFVPGQNHIIKDGCSEGFNLIDKLPLQTFSMGNVLDGRPMLAYKGRNYNPDVAMYLYYNPGSSIETVLGAMLPVAENKI